MRQGSGRRGNLSHLRHPPGEKRYTRSLVCGAYPGQGLEEVPLTQTLPKGTYEALVEYRCILLEDGKTPLNTAESGFTLYVS